MKEFSSYYYAKSQEINPGDYRDVSYLEHEVSVQKSVATQVYSSGKVSCDTVCKSTMVKNHE